MTEKNIKETIVPTICASHCGGSCLLKVHVKEGVITRIESDDGEEPQLRACQRGRAYRQRIYAPDRLIYPMKRIGTRGGGKFERISWDEAFETVSSKIKSVWDTYGPKSVIYLGFAGDLVCLNTSSIRRTLSLVGGFTNWWGITSFHGGLFASYFSYGSVCASNTRDDLLNSRLILMWGWDPATTVSGSNTAWFLAQARENGTKIIALDPWYSDSAATFAHEWIPVRPGTDTAMAIAMAYVMIKDNLHDQNFLNKYTLGFNKFKNYVLGIEDGIPKTATWAEAITGVPAVTIERIAREYATAKPAALLSGTGPGRTAFGEQFHRATITLAAMTGNVGVHGGDAAARAWESTASGYPYPIAVSQGLPYTPNPVEEPPKYPFLPMHYTYPHVHHSKIADAILQGKAGGYPADYKLLLVENNNYLNSLPNINKIVKALNAIEFIVVLEQFMTATARYADIILPTTTFLERNDIAPGVGLAFIGMQNKVVEPLGECKSQVEIARELAKHLGIENFDDITEEEHLLELAKMAGVPDYESFKKEGLYRIPLSEPYVAFKPQIDDPQNNPFPTPSGKIEIYSQQIADMADPMIPSIPKYIESWESINDPLTRKYPLQLITNHHKRRANAQYDNIPWLNELMPQAAVINANDAQSRGIKNGDVVRVFNDRGEVRVLAQTTERLMPSVVILPAGAWYNPDKNGIDQAGSANVLTKDDPSPAGSFPYNSGLVQILKV